MIAADGHNEEWRVIKSLQVFDIGDQIIESIQLEDEHATHLHYTVGHEVANFGKKLSIFIPNDDHGEMYVNIFCSFVSYQYY